MRARPQGIARGWVALVLAGVLLACSGASFAQRTEGDRASARGAYEAEVALRNQTEGERERAAGAPETSGYLKDADALVGFQDYTKLEAICRDLASGRAAPRAEGVPVAIGDKRFKGLAAKPDSFK